MEDRRPLPVVVKPSIDNLLKSLEALRLQMDRQRDNSKVMHDIKEKETILSSLQNGSEAFNIMLNKVKEFLDNYREKIICSEPGYYKKCQEKVKIFELEKDIIDENIQQVTAIEFSDATEIMPESLIDSQKNSSSGGLFNCFGFFSGCYNSRKNKPTAVAMTDIKENLYNEP